MSSESSVAIEAARRVVKTRIVALLIFIIDIQKYNGFVLYFKSLFGLFRFIDFSFYELQSIPTRLRKFE